MQPQNTNSGVRLQGRIDTKVHNLSDLAKTTDNYESLNKSEKLELTREVQPEYEQTVHNVTTDRFHEYFADNLDPTDSGEEANLSAEWLGLGTNGGGGTSTSDTDLNSRVYAEPVTDGTSNGKELLTSTFLDSTEGNGNTFDELGLFSGNPANLGSNAVFLMNHATFADVVKDNTRTVTFDVTLTFSDA